MIIYTAIFNRLYCYKSRQKATGLDGKPNTGGGIHLVLGEVKLFNSTLPHQSVVPCPGKALVSEGHAKAYRDECQSRQDMGQTSYAVEGFATTFMVGWAVFTASLWWGVIDARLQPTLRDHRQTYKAMFNTLPPTGSLMALRCHTALDASQFSFLLLQ